MNGLETGGVDGEMSPAGVGELLSRIWKPLSGDVQLYLKLAAPVVGAIALLEGGLFWALHVMGLFPIRPGVQPPQQTAWMMPLGMFIILPPVMAAYAIYQGAACSAAMAALSGSRMSFREAYGMAGSRARRLVWMMFLRMAAVMLPFVAAFVVIAMGVGVMAVKGGTPHPALYFVIVPLVIALYAGGIVWIIWMSLHWMLAEPACMAEDLTAWNALKRSGQLSRDGKWRMLGVFILVALIATAAVFALEMLAFALLGVGALAGMVLHVHLATEHLGVWIWPLAILGVALFYVVIALQFGSYAVTMSVLYDDQRFRMEGIAPAPPVGEPAA